MKAADTKYISGFYIRVGHIPKEHVFSESGLSQGGIYRYFSNEDAICFLATSLDGIIRDVILCKHYHIPSGLPDGWQLDETKLMHALAIALIALLGGDELKIFEEEHHNESKP
ncbi:MAG: hypothetical protein FWG03_09070 [Clostridiales bacterium]|nr:hypothetical protein [Clostridiales bacterium]